ncbi:hypothetical protein BCR39DRAFT_528583 [Naematelia encephala]|uniref:RNI-like protein n=1 Tax=Naematelia encephala TaxID=71784 RepID=A0A1Y2B7L5_9TREE|nr:hypothetical protein BCR39DRAFT_528583 [Naematelia encephala]
MAPKKRKVPGAGTSKASPAKRSKQKHGKVGSSVWNTPDDWDALVAASSLSTSSVSVRRPRPRGLNSLVKCCTEASARGFKRLWDTGAVIVDGRAVGRGEWWKAGWDGLPDHLKIGVRDAVFRLWGGYLTIDMISHLFIFPPGIYLPTALLTSIQNIEGLKPLHPARTISSSFTSLYFTHSSRASDIALAGMVWWMPNLENVNLKGCSLAGPEVVEALIKQCPRLKKINLRGTKVGEKEIKGLLDAFGKQLEGFKVDQVIFQNINDTFGSSPYPKLTHLCLPGDMLNAPSTDFRARARAHGQTVAHPTPRPTPIDSIIQWNTLSDVFPAITHFSIPGLLVPPGTKLDIPTNQLVKFKLGPGGPPVPAPTLTSLITKQSKSLRTLHLGHFLPTGDEEFFQLAEAVEGCQAIEEFVLQVDRQGSADARCDRAMAAAASWIFHDSLQIKWSSTLKRISLILPQGVKLQAPSPLIQQVQVTPVLEQLDLPGTEIDDLAEWIAQFPKLRSLDISGTKLTDEEVFAILDACPLLSRVDLTSCRGVNVRNRRNIFKAWEEARGS